MRARTDLILRQVSGENILIPVGEAAMKIHGMACLNESGLLLWKALSQETCEDELVRCLLSEYETDEETARRDVLEFIQIMRAAGALIEEEG